MNFFLFYLFDLFYHLTCSKLSSECDTYVLGLTGRNILLARPIQNTNLIVNLNLSFIKNHSASYFPLLTLIFFLLFLFFYKFYFGVALFLFNVLPLLLLLLFFKFEVNIDICNLIFLWTYFFTFCFFLCRWILIFPPIRLHTSYVTSRKYLRVFVCGRISNETESLFVYLG